MVKELILISDIHIQNTKRLDEYKQQLGMFLNQCSERVRKHNHPEDVRIVILGDLVHNKTNLSPECNDMLGEFLTQLDGIAKTIVICGNHDVGNMERLDSITPIFKLANFNNCIYLDKQLSYHSGCFPERGIVWCLYSIFDGFQRPNIDEMRIKYPDYTFIGLIHGDVVGAKTDLGRACDTGLNNSQFSGLDYVLCGHIHKYQNVGTDELPIIYPSSPIQQNFGENINGHGYVVLDLSTKKHELIEIPNNYGFYKFSVNSVTDIENGLEKLVNSSN